jgi:tRNA(Arg) A34 adenosine deaminase TadA
MGRHLLKATVRDKRGRILAIAHNSYAKTHPLQDHFAQLCGMKERPYLHAEIAALLKCKGVVPYSIHVERYKKDGTPALAAPCPICAKAIKAWGVKHTTFTGM